MGLRNDIKPTRKRKNVLIIHVQWNMGNDLLQLQNKGKRKRQLFVIIIL